MSESVTMKSEATLGEWQKLSRSSAKYKETGKFN